MIKEISDIAPQTRNHQYMDESEALSMA